MKARLIVRERVVYSQSELVEMVVWELPAPVPPSTHLFKYRLVYVVNGVRVLGYDNERGKGDHKHVRNKEISLAFTSIERLLAEFVTEVELTRQEGERE